MALVPLALLWLAVLRIPVTPLLVRVTALTFLALVLWRWLVRGVMRQRVTGSTSKRVNESTTDRTSWSSRLLRIPSLRHLVTSLPRSPILPYPYSLITSSPHHLVAFTITIILLLSAILSFAPLAELVLPAWIDSVHHVMVTQLILDQGGVPDSYQPFLPVSPFVYHFGFHAMSAAFVWLLGAAPASAVLLVGQALNFLAPLSACWLALRLTGMRWAGVISALIVGTVSLMPTHYVNWGRYTHLAGMCLLPVVIVLTVDALDSFAVRKWGRLSSLPRGQARKPAPHPISHRELDSGTRRWGTMLAAGVSLAGLALTHYRVLVFALAYLVVYLVVSLPIRSRWTLRRRIRRSATKSASGQALVQRLRPIGAVATVALLLASPWLFRIGRVAFGESGLWAGLVVDASYNAFPHDLLLASVNRPLAVLAVWGWLLALWKRSVPIAAVGLWIPTLFLVANPQILGLPASPLITNSSVIISLYLPLALLVGYFGAVMAAEVEKRLDRPWRSRLQYALAAVVIVVALWGARSLWPVIVPGSARAYAGRGVSGTPETVLAEEEDRLALSWIKENVPEEAKFLISSRRWQSNIYVGTDGGYWIPPLTGRQTTVPPALYVQGPPEYVAEINGLAEITAAGPDVDDQSFREILARTGVTHVYVGARGSLLRPQAFVESNYYTLAYASGNVWIFEVLPREG